MRSDNEYFGFHDGADHELNDQGEIIPGTASTQGLSRRS